MNTREARQIKAPGLADEGQSFHFEVPFPLLFGGFICSCEVIMMNASLSGGVSDESQSAATISVPQSRSMDLQLERFFQNPHKTPLFMF